MNTIVIPVKEYRSLVFAKSVVKKVSMRKKGFMDTAFGIWKKDNSAKSSVSIVNKLRASWRT